MQTLEKYDQELDRTNVYILDKDADKQAHKKTGNSFK